MSESDFDSVVRDGHAAAAQRPMTRMERKRAERALSAQNALSAATPASAATPEAAATSADTATPASAATPAVVPASAASPAAVPASAATPAAAPASAFTPPSANSAPIPAEPRDTPSMPEAGRHAAAPADLPTAASSAPAEPLTEPEQPTEFEPPAQPEPPAHAEAPASTADSVLPAATVPSVDPLSDALGLDVAPVAAPSRRRRRRRSAHQRLLTVIVLVLALLLVGGVGYVALQTIQSAAPQASVDDYTGRGTDDVVITIPDGATGQDIAAILHDADVVATVKAFVQAFNNNNKASQIQPGSYTLKKHMSAAQAVAALLDPASKSDHSVTIPEGYTSAQVKERLVEVGGFSPEEVDAVFGDAAAIGLPEQANGNVEGWLAPSTYDITEGASLTDIVSSMVATTRQNLVELSIPEADYETVLIKASIIEREVSQPQYYANVARVIDNRLSDTAGETKGFLQMDSTVLYGLGRTGGIPSAAEIGDSSNAYNTYQHAGLPPTPIGNPGIAAIRAAASPAAGDWLYFVTVNLETGETLFATTHDEQVRNTEQLTEYCREHEDVCKGS